jgi:hypothetical protein
MAPAAEYHHLRTALSTGSSRLTPPSGRENHGLARRPADSGPSRPEQAGRSASFGCAGAATVLAPYVGPRKEQSMTGQGKNVSRHAGHALGTWQRRRMYGFDYASALCARTGGEASSWLAHGSTTSARAAPRSCARRRSESTPCVATSTAAASFAA